MNKIRGLMPRIENNTLQNGGDHINKQNVPRCLKLWGASHSTKLKIFLLDMMAYIPYITHRSVYRILIALL